MNNFRGGSRPRGSFGGKTGGRPPFKKKSYGARGDSSGPRATMYPATCSKCGNKCEVPFEPSGDRPVLCRDCFVPKAEMGERGARPSFSKFGDKKPYGKSFGDRSYDSRESSAPRRQYERKEFTPAPAASDRKQLDEINSKLDRLIAAIERMTDDK